MRRSLSILGPKVGAERAQNSFNRRVVLIVAAAIAALVYASTIADFLPCGRPLHLAAGWLGRAPLDTPLEPVIYYGRSEKGAAVQGGAVLSSGEPDRASGVLLRRGGEEPLCRGAHGERADPADASRQAQVQIPTLRACMRINDIFTATYSPGSDPLKSRLKQDKILFVLDCR